MYSQRRVRNLAAKTYDELFKNITNTFESTLEAVAVLIQEIIKEHIREYYSEFDPEYYIRTNQFLNSCVRSDMYIRNGKPCIDVYINYNNIYYEVESPWQVINWANRGLHGGYDPNVRNEGLNYRYSHFWDDAMDEITPSNSEVIQNFIKWMTEKTGVKIEKR